MRVIVPYANAASDPEVHYCVKLNLQLLGVDTEWRHMTDPHSYAMLINELWATNEPFIIHEHDVFVWRGAIEELADCPEPFCGFDGTICCAKLDPARLGPCPVNPRTHWMHMDGELHHGLYDRGIKFHDHIFVSRPIINLNKANVPQ